ncbi:MAG: hypothetical protein L0Z50_13410 [Verrucomicrobiales bacterium]|nr:hypothetical protein [Verrucomicrobiales bacterium]
MLAFAKTRFGLLIFFGFLQAALYFGVLMLTRRDGPDEHSLLSMGLFMAAFALYLMSLALVWQEKGSSGDTNILEPHACRQALVIAGFALAFRLLLLWSPPIQENDFYRYLWDGRVVSEGINPYLFTPSQIEDYGQKADAPLILQRLSALRRSSKSLDTIFSQVDHREIPTIYPPISQAVFAVAAMLTPVKASLGIHIIMMKAILLLFDLATIWLVWQILRAVRPPPGRLLAYAWCPLVLKEFANSAHLDSVAVCLVTGAIWLMIRLPGRAGDRVGHNNRLRIISWTGLVVLFWALATLAKLYPVVLLPVFARWWWNRIRWRFVYPIAGYGFILAGVYGAVGFVHYQQASQIVAAQIMKSANSSASAQLHILQPNSPLSALGVFVSRWEMNDFLFTIVFENLRPTAAEAGTHPSQAWFVFTSQRWRGNFENAASAFFARIGLDLENAYGSFLCTQIFMGLVLVGICLWCALRSWPGDGRVPLLQSTFLCLAWLWFLSSTQNPWYWIWSLPFVAFVRPTWLLVSGFAFTYYLQSWFTENLPGGNVLGTSYTGEEFFAYVVVWLEHLPVLLALAALAAWNHFKTKALRQPAPRS